MGNKENQFNQNCQQCNTVLIGAFCHQCGFSASTSGTTLIRLVGIMNELREKCPWDQKQTIATLRKLTIEETYELVDAITSEDWKGIREELGDLMLHIVFYAKIATEKKEFTLDEVIHGICEKLITRHPHIYGDLQLSNEEEVKQNWEKIKMKEGKKSVLEGVPKSLPAMVKSIRLQEKSKQVGFEWENKEQVWNKVEEELNEFREALALNKTKDMEAELGDLFFSLINYARFLNIDAENALELTNRKFITRFNAMERLASERGENLFEMNLAQMDELWNQVKINLIDTQ